MRNPRTPLVLLSLVAASLAHADFTEGYEAGTQDVGNWNLTTSTSRPRVVEPDGGNPGGYLYGEVSSAIPGWTTVSTAYQPGFADGGKRDSAFTGDYFDRGVQSISADLDVFGVGSWTRDRALTLKLLQMDATGFTVNYQATYTIPLSATPPTGWNGYSFDIDANGGAVPAGWTFKTGTNVNGTDAQWADFTKKIDFVEFGYFKPGYAYPSLGVFKLGIDNVTITTQPTPEPAPFAALALGSLALVRRRRKA